MRYRHGAHTVFEIHLHLVWTTKYRKPVLLKPVGDRVRELIRQHSLAERVAQSRSHHSFSQEILVRAHRWFLARIHQDVGPVVRVADACHDPMDAHLSGCWI